MVYKFEKSEMGAQSAWKGFYSQTLYIASRLAKETKDYKYYPEDIEDLIIRDGDKVIEAVQIKNNANPLTLSSLADAATSKHNEGFFKRICSIHYDNPDFNKVRVVYFGSIGPELEGIENGNVAAKKSVIKKLVERHYLSQEDANWIVKSISFEPADITQIDQIMTAQLKEHIEVMAAPQMAKDLLVHYIARLSAERGFTSTIIWREKMHRIGVDVVAIDGFCKEYSKSLVRLSDLRSAAPVEQLKKEFSLGVSAQPDHIRENLDFKRHYWNQRIEQALAEDGVAVIKGVSGQGKTTLCYRYLMDNFPESCVFCVRYIGDIERAGNLAAAISNLQKSIDNIAIYIDVEPGETYWAQLIQELQGRGVSAPVLVSIREEDFNLTPLSGRNIQFKVVALSLSKEEAALIYEAYTAASPHDTYRSFDDAWKSFGEDGPYIEFMYLLTHSDSLKNRLYRQIDALLQYGIPDNWLELLYLVSYTGRIGLSVDIGSIREVITFEDLNAAIKRLKDEYLIRVTDNNRLEAVHPVRAKIIFEAIQSQSFFSEDECFYKALHCIKSANTMLLMLSYYSEKDRDANFSDISRIAKKEYKDWIAYGSTIKTMLWLDIKKYVEKNQAIFNSLYDELGVSWSLFIPLDFSGLVKKDVLAVEAMSSLELFDNEKTRGTIDRVKKILPSAIDYKITDYFLQNSMHPRNTPKSDEERSMFGYALFWMSKRGYYIKEIYWDKEVSAFYNGSLQSCADAIRGLYEQAALNKYYATSAIELSERIIDELNATVFSVEEDSVTCHFVPPIVSDNSSEEESYNSNQYWRIRMLNLLKQLYPDKELINIELVGVDLLSEIGINAYDNVLHIKKENRPDDWITEINGWTQCRIKNEFRPTTWKEYVRIIDKNKIDIGQLINTMIRLINDLYEKGRVSEKRIRSLSNGIELLNVITKNERLLPQSISDPFCMFSEVQDWKEKLDYSNQFNLISIKQFELFRKYQNAYLSSIDNFFNQSLELLIPRLQGNNVDKDRARLSLFNLYTAATEQCKYNYEFYRLFESYSELTEDSYRKEQEGIVILLELWRRVIEAPPIETDLLYKTRCKVRKDLAYFQDKMKIIGELYGYTINSTSEYIYILDDIGPNSDFEIGESCRKAIGNMRDVFSEAVPFSAKRWYCETQPLEIIYVPRIDNSIIPIAYRVPFYVLLNDNDLNDQVLIPGNIQPLIKELPLSDIQKAWINATSSIAAMKLYINRYRQVTGSVFSDNCCNTRVKIANDTVEIIRSEWKKLDACKNIAITIKDTVAAEYAEILDEFIAFCESCEEFCHCITNNMDLEMLDEWIEATFVYMILLQKYV